ncbi:DNA topoisomerase [Roseibium sp. RKSG952]|uniref:DNA topoisomerase n=1 Tax=Roseibium sp. RKSG952 TaxID=2529384 RepID=UPI0012BC967D|nr:DNA topoisomerase [Roseibium sp. RKSG952]MTH96696.1 type IA DNA topoisomerase [Roseibium sp. RKSG952]
MHDLFIIEAPGKAKQLEAILSKTGSPVRVQATKGHLYEMPKKLTPMGIDTLFREFERSLRDHELGERIRNEAKEANRVFVATDADQEGDVIAWDVAELIADIHPDAMRVRLKGMDEESVKAALDDVTPVYKKDAVPGRTRAIIDRMIGGTFSGNGVSVGRVGSALLGLVDKHPPAVEQLRLVARAKDGGRPWIVDCKVEGIIDAKVARQLTKVSFPALEFKSETTPTSVPPAHTGDIMVRAGDRLDMSPKESSTALQKLYEAGRMSYPRSGSRGISKGTLSKVEKILRKAGYDFDGSKVAEKSETETHDAPYPIGNVAVSQDPVRQGHQEGLRTMVGRDLLKSGQEHSNQSADTSRIGAFLVNQGFSKNVAAHIAGLDWRRECGPNYPGQQRWPESKVTTRRLDTALLEAAVKNGLGRPSTWANHIEGFIARDLVDDNMKLTQKGSEWLYSSPVALRDPRVSAAIEAACEKTLPGMMDDPEREPWELLAEKIVTALPDALKIPMRSRIDAVPPQPKKDPLAPFVETVGLDEALKTYKENTYKCDGIAPIFHDD